MLIVLVIRKQDLKVHRLQFAFGVHEVERVAFLHLCLIQFTPVPLGVGKKYLRLLKEGHRDLILRPVREGEGSYNLFVLRQIVCKALILAILFFVPQAQHGADFSQDDFVLGGEGVGHLFLCLQLREKGLIGRLYRREFLLRLSHRLIGGLSHRLIRGRFTGLICGLSYGCFRRRFTGLIRGLSYGRFRRLGGRRFRRLGSILNLFRNRRIRLIRNDVSCKGSQSRAADRHNYRQQEG